MPPLAGMGSQDCQGRQGTIRGRSVCASGETQASESLADDGEFAAGFNKESVLEGDEWGDQRDAPACASAEFEPRRNGVTANPGLDVVERASGDEGNRWRALETAADRHGEA